MCCPEYFIFKLQQSQSITSLERKIYLLDRLIYEEFCGRNLILAKTSLEEVRIKRSRVPARLALQKWSYHGLGFGNAPLYGDPQPTLLLTVRKQIRRLFTRNNYIRQRKQIRPHIFNYLGQGLMTNSNDYSRDVPLNLECPKSCFDVTLW